MPECDLNYARSAPNPFADQAANLVVLDARVAVWLGAKAADKGMTRDVLVNDVLRRDIDLIETVG